MILKTAVGVSVAALALAGCQSGTSGAARVAASARPVPTHTATTTGAGAAPAASARLLTCSDFGSQAAADAYLKSTPAARPLLDTNGDGIACSTRFTTPTPTHIPTRTVAPAQTTSAATGSASSSTSATKPACPVDRGPISGDWCEHSANGPDNPGFVAQCPVPGLPKTQWPAAVDGKCE